ncbi:serpin-ZXA isoform X2 [Hevea brasiliensis]|uniref:serpin-ZXA isoform X2 n=1 Tax=Hevea brasiliensis TaxID=3981 RepID=UPI0025D29C8B|nr:serpin-ZXA isoform X2 [Hevea brasiliensis]
MNHNHQFFYSFHKSKGRWELPARSRWSLACEWLGSTGRSLEQLLSFLESESISDLNKQSSQILAITTSERSPMSSHQESMSGHQRPFSSYSLSGIAGPSISDHQAPIIGFVNRLWVDHRFPLKESFKEIAKDVYNVEVRTVDFVTQVKQMKNEANLWAKRATKGLIKKFLPPCCFDKYSMLVLANALYFKGTWGPTFETSRTCHEAFHLLGGATIKVPFMTGGSGSGIRLFYGSFEGFKLLKLPYKNDQDDKQFCMYIFLPDKKNGLQKLIENINSDPRLLSGQLELEKVELCKMWIPKMKFSYHIEVSSVMKELGLTLPFKETGRELAEMVDYADSRKVRVSKLIHKSRIQVNKKGKEAAACNDLLSEVTSGPDVHLGPPPSFVADHPFIFMIKEEGSGVVFFVGAVLNPLLEA